MQENIIEIFSSIQGEGKYVGCRQVFIRLEGCNLACRYCDTENRPHTHPFCMVEERAGERRFLRLQNPFSAEQAAARIRKMLVDLPHHAVSFTGGEPLLHAAFIQAIAKKIKGKTAIFLETNGTLVKPLQEILSDIDIISMDIKMPSILSVPQWEAHVAFLQVAQKKDLYVKVVVSNETGKAEFFRAVHLVRENAPYACFIIQPVTPFGGCVAASPQKILDFQEIALRHLADVRVIPQTHKLIGQL